MGCTCVTAVTSYSVHGQRLFVWWLPLVDGVAAVVLAKGPLREPDVIIAFHRIILQQVGNSVLSTLKLFQHHQLCRWCGMLSQS